MSSAPESTQWDSPSDPELHLGTREEEQWHEAEVACEEYVELIRDGVDLSIDSFAHRQR